MHGGARKVPSARPPWGLLGMIGLVVAIEAGVAHLDVTLSDTILTNWKLSGRMARARSQGSRVLCFGDSQVAFGIAPTVLEGRSGARAYNLAVIAGQAPTSYFLLRRALEAGATPAALLVNFKPHLLSEGPDINEERWPALLDPREGLELAWAARDADFLARLAVSRALPSVHHRRRLRDRVREALGGQAPPSAGWVPPPEWRNWNVNRGALIAGRRPAYHGEVNPADRYLFPATWRPHPVNVAFLGRFLALAARRNVPVFWVLPPVVPAAQERLEQTGLMALHTRFARAVQARYPGVTILDARRSRYDPSVFIDPIHLDGRGAYALSVDVADVVGRRVGVGGSAGWVDLPAYRDRPGEVPLEDLDRSLALVLSGSAGPRR